MSWKDGSEERSESLRRIRESAAKPGTISSVDGKFIEDHYWQLLAY